MPVLSGNCAGHKSEGFRMGAPSGARVFATLVASSRIGAKSQAIGATFARRCSTPFSRSSAPQPQPFARAGPFGEIALLRHQFTVLQRSVARPRVTRFDRIALVALAMVRARERRGQAVEDVDELQRAVHGPDVDRDVLPRRRDEAARIVEDLGDAELAGALLGRSAGRGDTRRARGRCRGHLPRVRDRQTIAGSLASPPLRRSGR